jgi:hypothetical protein
MSAVEALLYSLRKSGVNVWLDGDELRYRASKRALQLVRLAEIRARKTEIVEFLKQAGKQIVAESHSLVLKHRPEQLPLSYAQERLWFLEQLGVGSAYNVPAVLRLEGSLDVSALERSIGDVVRRHESLRTRVEVVDGHGIQVIDEPGGFRLDVVDLSGLEETQRQTQARRLAREDAERPFDLAAGPLFRVRLLRLGTGEHVALVNMHHIVSDGWSLGVLIREIGVLYAAYVAERAPTLPELPVQYADYAIWQRGWLTGEALGRQVGYWKKQLAGAPAALDLPSDRPRPAVQSFR